MSQAKPGSYRSLFDVPGVGRILGSVLLARTAVQMQTLTLVLLALQLYGSAPLAGALTFLGIGPGSLLSPIAGALLDRHDRMRLITIDYGLAGLTMAALGVLALSHHLPVPLLLLMVTVACSTNALSNTGARSVIPLIVPTGLWDRVNAVDSGSYVLAVIVGPAAAGILVATLGVAPALFAIATLYGLALLLLVRLPLPPVPSNAQGSLWADAWRGVVYVFRQPQLRGLAATVPIFNITWGILTVGLPVLLLSRFHQGASAVGFMWTLLGAAGIVSALVCGRINSAGREVWFLCTGALVGALAMSVLLFGNSIAVVAIAMAIYGAGNGPVDIGMFSLRQRTIPKEWMGRAYAVSMGLNFSGIPLGGLIGGALADRSLSLVFGIGLAAALVAAAIAWATLRTPRHSADLT